MKKQIIRLLKTINDDKDLALIFSICLSAYYRQLAKNLED